MKDFLIGEYIKRLTGEDIKDFARKEGITINNDETEIIHSYLKTHWRTLLYGNPKKLLQELKIKLNEDTYYKVEQLYIQLKNKIN